MEAKFNDNPFNKLGYGNWGYYRERAGEKGLSVSDRIKRGALLVLASIPLINILVSGIEWASRRFKKLDARETPTVEKTDEQRERLLDSNPIVPSVKIPKTPLQLLKKDLQSWIDNPKAKGKKVEAAKAIKNAFNTGATELNLDGLNLNLLPDCIGSLTQLRDLVLSQNQIKELPGSIGSLIQLQKLDLSYNSIKEVPESIGSLIQLQKLDLRSNWIKEVPESIGSLTQLRDLVLNQNQIKEVPESIGSLIQLQNLDLSSNQIKEIPEWIGNLAQLQRFHLRCNELTAFPESIGSLIQLQNLDLSSNQIKELPESIGNQTQLQKLRLRGCKLASLPEAIGSLTQLQELCLDNNNLTSLPRSIGNLALLETLFIYDNGSLNSLPMSLGHIPGLMSLDIDGTQISEQEIYAILRQCEALRKQSARLELPLRLNTWKISSKTEIHLEPLLEFTESEKGHINEWLLRLERAKDFSGSTQMELAKTVVGILASVIENNDFRKDFLIQIEENNAACGDRAAMGLNELYTAWKIACLPKNTSNKEKLSLIERAAKTFALRKAMGNALETQKKKTGQEEKEGVEIYLYYETELKATLNLLSAIEHMSYSDIGKRDWIDQDALIKHVNETYLDELMSMNAFQALYKDNEQFKTMWASAQQELYKVSEELEEKKDPLENAKRELMKTPDDESRRKKIEVLNKQLSDLDKQMNELPNLLKSKEKQVALEWYQMQMAS